MNQSIRRNEIVLLSVCLLLAAVAALAPSWSQPAQYHAFADQRSWLDIAHALDVLSNLAFAGFGVVGLMALAQPRSRNIQAAERQLASVFFIGMLVTTLCSSWYHLQPDDARLAVDRCGMVVAFAGLLGLALATHVGARSGYAVAGVVLLAGPWGAWYAQSSGNVVPWGVVQFGAIGILLALAWLRSQSGSLSVKWGAVIAIYAMAKLLELADTQVFEITGQIVSGHSLKHLVSAAAAWPVITAIRQLGQNGNDNKRRTL